MTQDEIIEMAVLAGLEQDGEMWFSNTYKTDMDVHISHLEAFAKLVDAKATAKEREACAKVAQKTVCDTHISTGVRIYGTAAAKAIRARGEPTSRGEQHEQ